MMTAYNSLANGTSSALYTQLQMLTRVSTIMPHGDVDIDLETLT